MTKYEIESYAHGRVNLIGEHTDYNGGFVFPTCIPQKTRVQLRRRDDSRVRAVSANFPEVCEYILGGEKASRSWGDYLQGVTAILKTHGYEISGFECEIESSVPLGSGLSSSAALEISLLRALNEAFSLHIDPVEMARLGQKVENDFVGARVGIMDQMVCSLGNLGEALFIDTRSLFVRSMKLPLDQCEFFVINSGVAHNNAHGDYNTRRSECERACAALGVRELRDFPLEDLPRLENLPEPIKRRARHVVTENARVLEAVAALESGDFKRLGHLFLESHRSMRDDYEISIPELDFLVELAMGHPEVYGARLTGAGFGGSIVGIVQAAQAGEVAFKILDAYKRQTKRPGRVLVPERAL